MLTRLTGIPRLALVGAALAAFLASAPTAPPARADVELTLPDGRRVLLRDDHTWSYVVGGPGGAGGATGAALAGFTRTEYAAISGHNHRHLVNVTPEDCARACVEESQFRCQSFDFYRGKAACDLSARSADEVGLRRNYGPYDHYARGTPGPGGGARAPQTATSRFTLTRAAAISGYNDGHLRGVTVEQCARACLDESRYKCLSFDYHRQTRECDLSKVSARDVPLTTNVPQFDHYDLGTGAGAGTRQSAVSRFTLTRAAAISGYNDGHLKGVTVEQCAEACLEETRYQCRSFDYHRRTRECDLSKVSALDVPLTTNVPQFDHYDLGTGIGRQGAVRHFQRTEHAAIRGHNNRHLRNVSPEQCARACLEERRFQCQSFDYYRATRECDLSARRAAEVGLTTNYAPYDHYARVR